MFTTSVRLFDQPIADKRTVVCFGTPRGGTSMVAGAMAGLGIRMGPNLPVNVEDPAFNPDVFGGDGPEFIAQVQQTIVQRRKVHDVWGWKYPRASRYLERVVAQLPAPRFVVVFRDPVPAAMRAAKRDGVSTQAQGKTVQSTIAGKLRAELKNLNMCYELGLPTLLVSFEKAQANPEAFLTELASFTGMPLPHDLTPILDFMTPGSYKDITSLLPQTV